MIAWTPSGSPAPTSGVRIGSSKEQPWTLGVPPFGQPLYALLKGFVVVWTYSDLVVPFDCCPREKLAW